MPRGTTLVGLPQPTPSVQSKVYSIPLLAITGGIRPSLTVISPWYGGQVVLSQVIRQLRDYLTKDHPTI